MTILIFLFAFLSVSFLSKAFEAYYKQEGTPKFIFNIVISFLCLVLAYGNFVEVYATKNIHEDSNVITVDSFTVDTVYTISGCDTTVMYNIKYKKINATNQ